MLRISIFLIAMVSLLIFSVSNATEVILEDTPNVGDTTTITTITTGNPVTTNNLLSQDWIDGSWVGDMFPDSSDINENTWLTGKDGKYAETILNSEDYVTLEELQQGFTSTFGAQIRWWNHVESTVTMTQSISNGVDTTTQSTTFEDTTNSSYQVNPYGNTLVMSPDPDMTHGTATYRFDFDIQGNKNYNGGHAGVDVRDPTAVIDFTALSSTTVTTVEYCWQKNPPTCPGQDEIEDVQEQLEQFDLLEFTIPDDIFTEPPPEIEYTFVPIFEEEVIEIEEFYEMPMDNFFFEPEYYEEVVMEEFIPVDITMAEDIEFFDELPPVEMFEEMPMIEEIYEAVPDTLFAEEFTEDMQEEFIEEVEEYFEEVAMVEEEPIEEIPNEIEEQPSSEEIVADEPAPTEEIAKQEETIEEPAEVAVIEGKPTEEPDTSEQDVEVNLDIKVAKIEQAIQCKIKDVSQQIDATLTVVNELVSREMISQQPNMSSYFNANTALFDTRQLPSGNLDFFLQTNLDDYSKPIYVAQANIAGTDPVVQHQIKLNEAKTKTDKAYRKLKELLNARNVQ